jgi:hypothetical protein
MTKAPIFSASKCVAQKFFLPITKNEKFSGRRSDGILCDSTNGLSKLGIDIAIAIVLF